MLSLYWLRQARESTKFNADSVQDDILIPFTNSLHF